jgi:hypothetical protein
MNHWVVDIDEPERASRDFTGYHSIPKSWWARAFAWLLGERGLAKSVLDATSIDDISLQQRFDIRRALTDAEERASTHFFEYGNVVTVFDREFLPAAAAAGETPEEFQDKFYTWFRAQSRYRYWRHFEATARVRNENHRVQSIPEAIAAAEALANLVSAVIHPLATSEKLIGFDDDKNEVYELIILWGTQLVRYATGDELHDLRKTIDAIKRYLMLRRTEAQLLLQLSDSKSSGDGWYPGSWDDVAKEDFVISIPGLSDTTNGILHQVLYGPIAKYSDQFKVPPGPETGEWHTRLIFRVLNSVSTLLELSDVVNPTDGNILTEKELKERWIPKLIDTPNEDLVLGWWDEQEKRVYAEYDPEHDPEHPDYDTETKPSPRVYRAVPYCDLLYWEDTAWVFGPGDDQCVFPQVVAFARERFRENGIPESAWIRIDGPDPNYFRHRQAAREIWRTQPLINIWKWATDEIVKPKIAAGDILGLRPDLVKFFTGFPTRHEYRREITWMFEWFLRLADNLTLAWIVWLSIAGDARIADLGDVKKALADGWGIYPTEHLAEWFPNDIWGDPDEPDKQYNRYTFDGQERARIAFAFIAYEMSNVSYMKGVIESLHVGFATADELLDDIKSGLKSRRLYWRRFQDLARYVKNYITTMPGRFFDVLGRIKGKVNTPASGYVDNYGISIVRRMIGEKIGDDGWVQAVLTRRWINKIREQMPGV